MYTSTPFQIQPNSSFKNYCGLNHIQYTSKKSYHTFENNTVATLRPSFKQRLMALLVSVVITTLTAVKRHCNNNTHCCKMAAL